MFSLLCVQVNFINNLYYVQGIWDGTLAGYKDEKDSLLISDSLWKSDLKTKKHI